MPDAYVAFYWTFPFYQGGFVDLSDDPDEAARQSRTIRYQVALVRGWVREHAGRLVAEIPFLEVSPDRGTDVIREGLARATAHCLDEGATLLYVDFAKRSNWRPHPDLHAYLEEHSIPSIGVFPKTITMDGERVDPIKHFQRRRKQDKSAAWQARYQARAEILALAAQLGNGRATIRLSPRH